MNGRITERWARGIWRWWGIPVALAGCGGPATDPTSSGSGTVSGTIDGRAFDAVGSVWLAGEPDDASTTVIYVFDGPVACDDLATPGWDTRIADGTQAVELKLIGKEPGEYPVPADGRPSGGESDDNYTLTSTSGTPSEISATSGTVTLDALVDSTSATGSFDLAFPTGQLTGTFVSGWCASANEP